jgi:hypothetical protein
MARDVDYRIQGAFSRFLQVAGCRSLWTTYLVPFIETNDEIFIKP